MAVGAAINGWRLRSHYTSQIDTLTAQRDVLGHALDRQNTAVEALKLQGEAVRRQTDRRAAHLARREATVAALPAADCQGVLQQAWKDWP